MNALGDPSRGDTAAALLLAGVLIALAILVLAVNVWAVVGSGLAFAALWIWIRLRTGVWVDDFADIEIRHVPRQKVTQ